MSGRAPLGQLTAHTGSRITLDGRYGPIAALSAGVPAAATVLLVPGYTGSKEDFTPMLDGIAAAGFRAVALDLPGQHESGGPPDESAYLPAALGEVIAKLIESLTADGPVLLLGHSYGGLVARGAVLAGARVAGLTLMDSGPRHLPDGVRLDALALGEPMLRENGLSAAYAVRERVSAQFPAWALLPAELKDFLRARFVTSSAPSLLGMAHGLRTEPDLVTELAGALTAAAIPCLVVAGEQDDAWSVPDQRAMAGRLDAPFAAIPDAAHSPNTENPAALLATLLPTWHAWLES
ncbi:alpha/beta fold hydrolase [Amycolatopsis nigrescens]|uniref:alpha/beta fold hydrolase n=1 Tax=Amycolatopsis nigrescens TaxID=381445 RepID=UPI00035FB0BF|nr:alpha/beta fold hydrolase [Amycolatopsis nigrescens]